MRGLVGITAIRNMLFSGAALLLSAQSLAESYEVREYDSPMTVETTFAVGDHSLWSAKQWHSSPAYERISGNICEHVKITKLELNVEPLPKPKVKARKNQEPVSGPDLVKLGIRGRIRNDFGGDKLALMRFEVFNGADVTAVVNVRIAVEEDEERGFKGFATVPAEVLPTDPSARMRITMNVELD